MLYLCTRKRKPQGIPIQNGALDERFSLWSAKPARAVRLRHAPHKNVIILIKSGYVFFAIDAIASIAPIVSIS